MVTEGSYGTWKSPLTSKIACDASIAISRMYADKHNSEQFYWCEQHPTEGGATLVFSKDVNASLADEPFRWTPKGYDAFNMVHEYGGAPFIVDRDTVYFTNLTTAEGAKDNKFYSQTEVDLTPKAITKKDSNFRYADADFSQDQNYFFTVREDHTLYSQGKAEQPENLIVAINVKTGEETVVASGNDFYSTPRVSPDGTKLVWVTWIHPNMPWDNTEIWVGEFSIENEGVVMGSKRKVAGEDGVNFMEPSWTADNKLMYICDRTDYWNLYQVDDLITGEATCVYPMEKEIGGACWDFGNTSYSPNPKNADQVVVLYGAKPALLSISQQKLTPINIDVGDVIRYATACAFLQDGENLFLYVVCPQEPSKIVKYNLSGTLTDFYHTSKPVIEPEYLSGEPVSYRFETVNDEASDPNTVLHAFGNFYPPKNQDFTAPADELPPVLVKVHGGPTSAASHAIDLQKQYFTSRGIAIFDLDYRGSTGQGTPFRNSLKGKWGVYDLTDAVKGVEFLASKGLIDGKKALISGGSSGGYTTLACLTFKNTDEHTVFATGTSYYGISDLAALAKDTHKFESKYCDTMIASYPECIEVYNARSPLYHQDQFKSACCFFQGELDEVVPKEQSIEMYSVLKENGITCSYNEFEGEYHGFKDSENQQTALDGEFYFYSVMLDFEPADSDIEIPIDNLPVEKKEKLDKRKKK